MPDSLSHLKKVDLRTVWENEAYDFTPWLAQAENLDRLGSAISIELELESTEKNVGPFNADVLCKDTVDDQWVLIENQLGRTDHTHMGQLLTYAAGLNAVTIVWIAKRFSDPHRAALDWLNEITEEGINFFGIEIQLWQIEDSPVAPKFEIISKPNDWTKAISRQARSQGELTETKQLQLEYWTEFAEYMKEHGEQVTPRRPRPQHWMNFAVGRSGCHLAARMNTQDDKLGVELSLNDGEEANGLFNLLQTERDAIEEDIERSLSWLPKPNKKRCLISYTWDAIPTDRNDWEKQHETIAGLLERFHRAFSSRLRRLDPSDASAHMADDALPQTP